VPEILRLPPNVYFVGTVNVDESTFSFSPKVLDRAFTIEFRDVDLAGYPFPPSTGAPAATFALPPDFTRSGRFAGVDKAAVSAQAEAESVVLERLRDLHKTLQPYGLEFGYRVVDEVLQFLAALGDAPVIDGLPRSPEDLAFDTALCMKVLPKFHGPFRHLEPGLTAVRTWAQDLGLDMTVKKIDDMVRRGLGQGHVSFF
jgi:5-methylcytosine-specific restriction endonuclease McrBC GTP-binding regulatory subunit McrB